VSIAVEIDGDNRPFATPASGEFRDTDEIRPYTAFVTFDRELFARAADELRAQGSVIAERSVGAQIAALAPRSVETLVRDARYNVEHLAEAIALGDPEAFAAYAGWLQGLLVAAAHVPASVVSDHLGHLANAVRERTGAGSAALAGEYIAYALGRLGREVP